MSHFVTTNGIRLHYLDYPHAGDETLLLAHGLTANAHFFGGLIQAGLADSLRVIAVDLRGRGLSDKPATGYSMADHAQDLIGLMDALGLESCMVGGHSFGGMLAIYIAAHYPQRVKKLLVMDAGILHPSVREIIKPSLQRLGKTLPSLEAYLNAVKTAPYYADGFWDAALEAYYSADVEIFPDGSARARSTPEIIEQAADAVLDEDWITHMGAAPQPALLLHAAENFGAAPVVTEEGAQQTVKLLPNCRYERATGHHISMCFGNHAPHTAATIKNFVRAKL